MAILPFKPGGPLAAIARRYAWSVPVVAALGLVASALEGAGIGLLIPLLTTLLNQDGGNAGFALLNRWLGGHGPDTRLVLVASAIFALIVLKNLVQAAGHVFVAWVDGRAGHDIRCALARQLLWVGYPFHLAQEPARLVNIVATEAWRASEAVRALFSMVAGAASALIFVALLLWVSWPLTLAVAGGMVVIRLSQAWLIRGLGPLSVAMTDVNRTLADRMLATVLAMRPIRVFNQERREQDRFAAASEAMRRAMLRIERASAGIPPLQEVLQTALFIAVLIGGTLSGSVAVPVLVTFLVLLQRMQPHVRTVEAARVALASAQGPIREVEWLLDPAGKPAPPSGWRPCPGVHQAVSFREVSFAHPSHSGAALDALTFDIPAGRATALMGPSGSGKSTVVNLLCRLLEPTSGAILVDGVNLAELEPAGWRARISLAGQDIELLDGTVAENIAYGAPGLPRAAIEAAARAADADAFIAALPQGYDSQVGSRGLSLSGGQRQRIGLARAVARHPDLLILDEATNAVDALSEAAIMRLLRQGRDGMTLVVISHRASTLACCDHGVVVVGGRVAESGPLQSLAAWRTMLPAVG